MFNFLFVVFFTKKKKKNKKKTRPGDNKTKTRWSLCLSQGRIRCIPIDLDVDPISVWEPQKNVSCRVVHCTETHTKNIL